MHGRGVAVPAFLPLLPTQILLNNILYDLSKSAFLSMRSTGDDLVRPRVWDMPAILRFTLVMGGLSSLFDFATFAVLFYGFNAGADLFPHGVVRRINGDPNSRHLHSHPNVGASLGEPPQSAARRDLARDSAWRLSSH